MDKFLQKKEMILKITFLMFSKHQIFLEGGRYFTGQYICANIKKKKIRKTKLTVI